MGGRNSVPTRVSEEDSSEIHDGSESDRGFDSHAETEEALGSDLQVEHPLIARILDEAQRCCDDGQFPEAQVLYFEALDESRKARDTYGEAQALLGIGYTDSKLGNHQKSLETLESVLMLDLQGVTNSQTVLARAYSGIGNASEVLGKYNKAVECHKADLSIAQQLDDKPAQGNAYCNLGRAYHDMGEYKKAIEHHEKHLSIAQQLDDKGGQGISNGNLGRVYKSLGEYKKAIELHEEELSVAEQLDDKSGQGVSFGNLGNAYQGLGKYKKAIEYHKKHLSIAQEQGDQPGQGHAYCGIGNAYQGLGEYRNAIEFYEKDLAIAQQLEDKPGQGISFGNLGNAYKDLGKYKKAIEYHEKDLAIAQQLNDKPGQGSSFGNLGNAYNGLGEYKKAIEYHEKHLSITKQLDHKPEQAKAYGNLGKAHMGLGEYRKAIEYHEEHLSIAQQLDDKSEQAKAYGNLGNAYKGLGEYINSISFHEEQLSIAKCLDSLIPLIKTNNSLGFIYNSIGRYEKAVDCFKQGLEHASKLDHGPSRCAAYSGLGHAHRCLGKIAEAVKYHEQELGIAQGLDDRCGLGQAYSGLGCAYWRQGDYQQAIKYHQRDKEIATELESKPALERAYGNLGDVYRSMEEYERAIEFHEEYLEIAQALEDKPAQVQANAKLGLELQRSGQQAAAFRHFAVFGQLLSDLESQLTEGQWRQHLMEFVEQNAEIMDGWVVAAAQADDMLEALRVEEWRRCRSQLPDLSDIGVSLDIKSMKSDVTSKWLKSVAKHVDASLVVIFKIYNDKLFTWVLSGDTGKMVDSSTKKKAGLASLLSNLIEAATFADLAKWQQALERARQEINTQRKKGKPTDEWLSQLCEKELTTDLRGDIEDDLWAELRIPAVFRDTVYAKGKAFETLYRHLLEKGKNALSRLNDLIWKPIVENCNAVRSLCHSATSNTKPVYFLPDSALSRIPFAAFKVGDRFLIEEVCVSQASSLRTLEFACSLSRTISDKKRPAPEALVVAYAETDEGGLFKEGGEYLGDLLATRPVSGEDASKEAVLQRMGSGSASLIHLMVHGGEVDDAKWAEVHLARGTVLSASELNKHFTSKKNDQHPLYAHLLVLCACSSAHGRHMSEGLQGFARAALAGGIPCLLASKWNVPLEESKDLMLYIYANMAKYKDRYKTVAEAFRTAVLELLAEGELRYRDSYYYWAAFLPHGFGSVVLDSKLLDQIHKALDGIGVLKQSDAAGSSMLEKSNSTPATLRSLWLKR